VFFALGQCKFADACWNIHASEPAVGASVEPEAATKPELNLEKDIEGPQEVPTFSVSLSRAAPSVLPPLPSFLAPRAYQTRNSTKENEAITAVSTRPAIEVPKRKTDKRRTKTLTEIPALVDDVMELVMETLWKARNLRTLARLTCGSRALRVMGSRILFREVWIQDVKRFYSDEDSDSDWDSDASDSEDDSEIEEDEGDESDCNSDILDESSSCYSEDDSEISCGSSHPTVSSRSGSMCDGWQSEWKCPWKEFETNSGRTWMYLFRSPAAKYIRTIRLTYNRLGALWRNLVYPAALKACTNLEHLEVVFYEDSFKIAPLIAKLNTLVYLRVVVDYYASAEELKRLVIPPNVRRLEIEAFEDAFCCDDDMDYLLPSIERAVNLEEWSLKCFDGSPQFSRFPRALKKLREVELNTSEAWVSVFRLTGFAPRSVVMSLAYDKSMPDFSRVKGMKHLTISESKLSSLPNTLPASLESFILSHPRFNIGPADEASVKNKILSLLGRVKDVEIRSTCSSPRTRN